MASLLGHELAAPKKLELPHTRGPGVPVLIRGFMLPEDTKLEPKEKSH